MSILFRIFVVEKETRIITPKLKIYGNNTTT